MGNACSGQENLQIQEINYLPSYLVENNQVFHKNNNISMRFRDVQKIRSGQNKYKFILTLQNSNQLVKIQLPVIRSYADQSIMDIAYIYINEKVPPIIDSLDMTYKQFYHNVRCNNVDLSLKVYSFQTYHDLIFKNGLYQIALYRQINSSYFKNAYLIERGSKMSLLMFFNRYDCTLFDLMQYRQLKKKKWTEDEQVYIVHKLINNYKKLQINNIVHRDIRPSKIYVFSNQNNIKTRAIHQNYEFANLESARKITTNQKRQFGEQMLLTIRGVSLYCSDNVRNLHSKNEQVGMYNYQQNDRIQLQQIIVALNMCDPFQNRIKLRKQHKLQKIYYKLQDNSISFQKIIRDINQLIKNIKIQNQYGILKSDIKIINQNLLQLIKKTYKDKIQSSVLQTLFLTHQRQQFTQKLTKIIQQNYLNQQAQLNIPILDRLGQYYQSIGITNNDYYRQQVNLLVDLAQNKRKRQFIQQSYAYLVKAKEIQNKLPKSMKTPAIITNLYAQYAYNQYNKGNYKNAQNYVNQALIEGSKSHNISIQIQLKNIQVKGLIQTEKNGFEAGDQYFEKGLQLCGNRSNFTSKSEMLQNKSTFQHRLADNILLKLQDFRNQSIQSMRKKYIGKCQSLLLSARDTRNQIANTNTTALIKINISLGDLACFRQNYLQSLKNYERADRLYFSSDVQLSESLKLKILNKINNLYESNIDDPLAQEKIIKKIKKIKQKQQSKVIRDPKKNFQRIKFKSKKQKQKDKKRTNIFLKEGIIEQRDQDDNQLNNQQQQMYWKSKYENKYLETS